ncbi:unnamed protein product [Polarella glacialis]|uniref:Uncharacterized protein n=1 Tax=Polarella glacialis TaxID=89957 RepID=A0A813LSS9_POLGL|nr:unnamed protein product [Polarella glacialis]
MAASLENQPYWAKNLLKVEEEADDEDVKAAEDASKLRRLGKIRNRSDLLNLIRGGEGSGVLVDDVLAQSYPDALQEIATLIRDGVVRHVQPVAEPATRSRRGANAAQAAAAAAPSVPSEFPGGVVLFPRFEPEVEALKVDEDILQAFHSVGRLQQGDVGARIAPKQDVGPKKRQRRVMAPRKVQNVHMAEG